MGQDNTQSEVPFEDLADRFTNEIRRGKSPKVSDYAQQFPAHESAIYRLFPVLEMMEKRGTPVEDLSESGLLAAEQSHQLIAPSIERLGDYRIIREIGRGGMGIVFEAEQESLGRRVALKLLPESARFDERRKQRFQLEAQASAKLQHPNIVNVFGVGAQDDTSYFVMQYIDGQPLNSVLKEVSRIRTGGLDSTQAVANAEVATIVESLQREPTADGSTSESPDSTSKNDSSGSFSSSNVTETMGKSWWRNVAKVGVQVASALEHAHNNRTLHRDIKPANLMIDATGNVWVTDFGLAKHFESTDLTRTGEVVGTLRYMSPEQLNGKADERSDIFALGLTLYEMAALQPAYSASDRNDLMKQTLDANPPRLRSLDRQIPRDLETIVHKCIAAEPKQRYQSAIELKQDLLRLLSGEPVLARRIGSVERAFKWCKRRPVIAALCGALAISLFAGIAGITWQWQNTVAALQKANENLTEAEVQNQRADKHFREARESVDKFYTIISEQRLLMEPGLQPLRKELMTEAASYYRNFSQQYADDESLKLETGKALLRLVQIEGTYSTNSKMLETCREAVAIFDELVENDADDQAATMMLAEAHDYESRLVGGRKLEDSLVPRQKAIDVLEAANERFEANPKVTSRLADQYKMLALVYEQLDHSNGRTDRSLENFMRAYVLRKGLAEEHADRLEFNVRLADSCRDLGITFRRIGDNEEAIAYFDEAMTIIEKQVLDHPDNQNARRTLASIANSVGYFYGNVNSELDLDRAIKLYKRSRDQYEFLSQKDPLIIEYQDGLGRAASNLGSIYQHKGDLENGLRYRKEGMEVREKVCAANPNAPHLKSNLALSINGVGSMLRTMGRSKEAVETQIRAHETHLDVVKMDPGNPRYKYRLIDGLIQLARAQCAAETYGDAVATVDSIEGYLTPKDTLTVAKAAKEYLLIACKIGKIDEDSRSEQDAEAYQDAIAKSKDGFRKSVDRGFNLPDWIEDDTDMRYFGELPEAIEMLGWIAAEFGKP